MESLKNIKVEKDTAQNINEQLITIRDSIDNNAAGGDFDFENESSYPYVIFQVADNKFAVNCKYVLSIEPIAETTEITSSHSEVRGIAYYKNEAVNVFDMRRMFGYISQVDHINNTINIPQRIQDHIDYEKNLKSCVENDTPFKLTVDPHECKFGKWFYSYKSKANLEIRSQLERIEPIHDKFHLTAAKIKNLIDSRENENEKEKGMKLLEETDNIKSNLLPMLDDLNGILLKNIIELMIVLKIKNKKVGIIVDSTESVETINEIQELPPAVVLTDYVKRMGLRKKDSEIVLILEATPFV